MWATHYSAAAVFLIAINGKVCNGTRPLHPVATVCGIWYSYSLIHKVQAMADVCMPIRSLQQLNLSRGVIVLKFDHLHQHYA